MPEFRNLWPYSVANAANSGKPYKYAVDNNLNWYAETGTNAETMFAVKFSTFADWGTSIYYSNQMNLFFGWRAYSYKGAMGEGWGMGTVNKKLWDAWPDADLRKRGSIHAKLMILLKASMQITDLEWICMISKWMKPVTGRKNTDQSISGLMMLHGT